MVEQRSKKVICLEGIVGAGKTTQIDLLYTEFSPDCYLIPELNEISPMKEVRDDLKRTGRISNMTNQDVLRLIRARGEIHQRLLSESNSPLVLMDRGIYTGMVFESGKLDMWEVEEISKKEGVIVPDLCFVLYCDSAKVLERVDERRIKVGKYKHRAFHENPVYIEKTKGRYFDIAKKRPVILVDASGNKGEIHKRLMEEIYNAGFL
ncbi:MAG: hypothetical protein KKF48_05230 [Nanoarchaeota archaeon]|nr:hypothetical protein [Nanoarchaeota archaeon]MBU1028421.1 hypothetical protein [Nanoarchaeota archaeon]